MKTEQARQQLEKQWNKGTLTPRHAVADSLRLTSRLLLAISIVLVLQVIAEWFA